MKYKVGDRVRIVNERVPDMNIYGLMDEWLGKSNDSQPLYEWEYFFTLQDGRR